ncbi:hypothetical protein PI125_g12390 [Phytophthora idaei]|nr:hypothetical protein PI125_g12390 [Phytophthora idaei]
MLWLVGACSVRSTQKLTPKVTQTSVYAEADYSLRVEKTLGRSKTPSQLVREICLSSCSSSDGEASTGGIGTEVSQIANAQSTEAPSKDDVLHKTKTALVTTENKDQKLRWNAE